jgi:hypothetical protein
MDSLKDIFIVLLIFIMIIMMLVIMMMTTLPSDKKWRQQYFLALGERTGEVLVLWTYLQI